MAPASPASITFEANGDFVTRHSISAVADNPTLAAVWVITQTIPTEFVFVPANPEKSPYEDGVYWFGFGSPKDQVARRCSRPSLLQIRPVAGTGYKLGAHPAKPALAAVHRVRLSSSALIRRKGNIRKARTRRAVGRGLSPSPSATRAIHGAGAALTSAPS
jgi:hypothetical protein